MSGHDTATMLAELERTGLIDTQTFSQILEMDDDEEERDFSKSIVFDFFDQAKQTFDNMDTAVKEKNLKELKELGHFLKGSSATLGLVKVRDSCEKIQHYGDMKDETGTVAESDPKVCLARIEKTVAIVKKDYSDVEKELRKFYSN